MTNMNDFHVLIEFPQDVDKISGRVIWGQLAISSAMIPRLFEMIKRNSSEVKRRTVEVPYSGRDHETRAGMDIRMNSILRHQALLTAAESNESVVSISPMRLSPFTGSLAYAGTAYIEYTTVPLAPWEDGR